MIFHIDKALCTKTVFSHAQFNCYHCLNVFAKFAKLPHDKWINCKIENGAEYSQGKSVWTPSFSIHRLFYILAITMSNVLLVR